MNINDYKIWENPIKQDIKIIGNEKLEKGNWINTEKVNYEKNGVEKVWERVVRDTVNGVVAVLPVTKDNEIIFIQNIRVALIDDDFDGRMLELPAGLVDDGETKAEAVNRELKEETGFSSDDINFIDTIASSSGMTNEEVDVFIALNCDRVTDILELDESEAIEKIYKVPYKEVDDFLENIKKQGIKKGGKIEGALRIFERKFLEK